MSSRACCDSLVLQRGDRIVGPMGRRYADARFSRLLMNREAAVGASRATRRVADLARSLVPCQQHVCACMHHAQLMGW